MRPEVLRQYLFEAASWFPPESVVVPRVVRGLAAVVMGSLGPLAFLAARPGVDPPVGSGTPGRRCPWLCILYARLCGVLSRQFTVPRCRNDDFRRGA
jgi:hypothetical protein